MDVTVFTKVIDLKVAAEAASESRKKLQNELLDNEELKALKKQEDDLNAEYEEARKEAQKLCEEQHLDKKVTTENGTVTPSIKKTFSVTDQKALTAYLKDRNEIEKVFKLEINATNLKNYVNDKDADGEVVDGVEVGETYSISVSANK